MKVDRFYLFIVLFVVSIVMTVPISWAQTASEPDENAIECGDAKELIEDLRRKSETAIQHGDIALEIATLVSYGRTINEEQSDTLYQETYFLGDDLYATAKAAVCLSEAVTKENEIQIDKNKKPLSKPKMDRQIEQAFLPIKLKLLFNDIIGFSDKLTTYLKNVKDCVGQGDPPAVCYANLHSTLYFVKHPEAEGSQAKRVGPYQNLKARLLRDVPSMVASVRAVFSEDNYKRSGK